MEKIRRGRRKKPRPISAVNSQSNLFIDDEKEVAAMIAATGRSRAEIVRNLVSTGVRAKRLHAVGKDEAMTDVIDAQKSVMSASIAPLVAALREEKDFVEKSVVHLQQDYASIEARLRCIEHTLGFIIKGFDRVLQNIIIIRALIWFYIFEFYFIVLHSTGRNPTREELHMNYEARLRDIKIEATKERSLCGELELEKTVAIVAKNMIADAKLDFIHF